jgi:hypothetical protein
MLISQTKMLLRECLKSKLPKSVSFIELLNSLIARLCPMELTLLRNGASLWVSTQMIRETLMLTCSSSSLNLDSNNSSKGMLAASQIYQSPTIHHTKTVFSASVKRKPPRQVKRSTSWKSESLPQTPPSSRRVLRFRCHLTFKEISQYLCKLLRSTVLSLWLQSSDISICMKSPTQSFYTDKESQTHSSLLLPNHWMTMESFA